MAPLAQFRLFYAFRGIDLLLSISTILYSKKTVLSSLLFCVWQEHFKDIWAHAFLDTHLIMSQQWNNGSSPFDGLTKELINNLFIVCMACILFLTTQEEKTYSNIGMHINPVFVKTLKQALCTDGYSTPELRASPCSSAMFLLFASTVFTAPDPPCSSVRTKLMWDNGPRGVSENAESDAFWH